jgi:hypothetical protein
MAHKVIVPQKKIMSRSFLNSGTLIVIRYWWKKHAWLKLDSFRLYMHACCYIYVGFGFLDPVLSQMQDQNLVNFQSVQIS